jgi:sugar phosphate isomerase/epimerase
MYLSSFADEAADDIIGQIEVIKVLGWKGIELRSVDGINAHDLPEKDFEVVRRALDKAELEVNCLGSTIANWGKKVDEDRAATLATVERAITRMKALRTKMIRIMSYAIDLDEQGRPLADQRFSERVSRLNEICGRFAAEGITPVHENCLNYGGMSWGHTLELMDAVPDLRLVFDTGNPSLTPDFSKPYPYPNQDSWETWERLKSKVVHLHVKDGWRNPENGEETYVYPGEGPSKVSDILADCLVMGYSGWLTIEPHMAVVFHDASVHSPAERRKAVFIEYGRRVESMLEGLGAKVADGVAATCWANGGTA